MYIYVYVFYPAYHHANEYILSLKTLLLTFLKSILIFVRFCGLWVMSFVDDDNSNTNCFVGRCHTVPHGCIAGDLQVLVEESEVSYICILLLTSILHLRPSMLSFAVAMAQ